MKSMDDGERDGTETRGLPGIGEGEIVDNRQIHDENRRNQETNRQKGVGSAAGFFANKKEVREQQEQNQFREVFERSVFESRIIQEKLLPKGGKTEGRYVCKRIACPDGCLQGVVKAADFPERDDGRKNGEGDEEAGSGRNGEP